MVNPKQRWTAKKLLDHPWIKGKLEYLADRFRRQDPANGSQVRKGQFQGEQVGEGAEEGPVHDQAGGGAEEGVTEGAREPE